MPRESWTSILGALASGRAHASWKWKTAAAVVPTLAAFLIQWYLLDASMARWALFYPAVFIASWLGGLPSGLAATALASALVPVFFFADPRGHILSLSNLTAAAIFVTMSIAVSIVHERLRTIMGQLEQSRQWLQAIMDNSPNVIIIKDFMGRYLMVNHELEDLLELEAGEATGKTDYAIFPIEKADHHRQTDVDVWTKRGAITYEETLELHGETRVFQASKFPLHDATGYPFALCAIWSDVTDRKRIEEELRQREADLRQAERVAHLGSWTWTVADDKSRWSDELYRIMGIEPPAKADEAIAGAQLQMAPETMAQIRAALKAVLSDGRPHETEMEIKRPDGTTRWLAARGDAVRNEQGEIIAVSGTAQDITELKELQRMRDEWTSVMAHDLRQPIGVITMAASALPELREAKLVDKEKDMITRIASAADGLARLVDDLLDLSLVEAHRLSLDRHWWKPQTVVHEAVERLSQMTDGHPIVVSEGQGLSEVCVDQMRMGQVLGNLISNAVKYGEAGSEIKVRVEQHDAEVEIDVENHGAGIPEQEISQLFNRFTRTKKARISGTPGLGVGLYIAKALVEAHGGRIWVESTPGETTTFHVALPARGQEQKVA